MEAIQLLIVVIGKNRPLDEEELEFLEGVRSQARAKERRQQESDAAELDAFQLVSVYTRMTPFIWTAPEN